MNRVAPKIIMLEYTAHVHILVTDRIKVWKILKAYAPKHQRPNEIKCQNKNHNVSTDHKKWSGAFEQQHCYNRCTFGQVIVFALSAMQFNQCDTPVNATKWRKVPKGVIERDTFCHTLSSTRPVSKKANWWSQTQTDRQDVGAKHHVLIKGDIENGEQSLRAFYTSQPGHRFNSVVERCSSGTRSIHPLIPNPYETWPPAQTGLTRRKLCKVCLWH